MEESVDRVDWSDIETPSSDEVRDAVSEVFLWLSGAARVTILTPMPSLLLA